jgi:hypothetical protein
MNDLTKKGVPFAWGTAEQDAFDCLKNLLTSAPLYALSNFEK